MYVFEVRDSTQTNTSLIQRLELAVDGMGKGVNLEHLELIADSMVTSGEVNGASLSGYKDLCETLSLSTPFSNAAFQVRALSKNRFLLFCSRHEQVH